MRETSDEQYNAKWVERIMARCVPNERGCWIYQGYKHRSSRGAAGQPGYGGTSYRGKAVRIHRKMLEIKLGRSLPVEIQACHECDNPPCCNPDHLYPGTNQQNHIDGGKRGRMSGQSKTHCKHGHEFTPENTRWAVRNVANGMLGKARNCKECHRICLRRDSAKRHLKYQVGV